MYHHSRRCYGTLITALLGLLPSACGIVSARPTLDPAQLTKVRATLSRSYIPERQVKITWVRSSHHGGLGLMGGVISSSVNRGRRNAAEEMVLPLHAQSQDVNYQWMLWNVLEPMLKQVPWLKSIGFEGKPAPSEDPSSDELVQHSLLRMVSDFLLSVDSSTLLVKTGFSFFEQGGSGYPAAATTVYYRSDRVGQIEDEKAISLWAANRAARYRMALAEGVAENVRMIGLALLCMGGMNCATGSQHHLHFRLNEGSGGAQTAEVDADGTIVEEGPYRVIFRERGGTFYSIPRSSIESQSGHGPPPAPVLVPTPPPVSPAPPPTLPPAPGS